ncbi:hypothetical protein [Psychroserpens algicola]|uniref:hypothetical protein n=1 Tax=Psychroserpens algicola TaxID=1719034 RepID=UPI001954E48F|nr:hypothetical protein [Psychroserpens algicola]
MKYIIIIIVMAFSVTMNAQQVEKDGKTYEVKKDKIFLNGEDVTETLNLEERAAILKQAATISEKMKMKEKAEKEAEKLEKDKKKAEKAQKKAEKEAKRAEKALKKKQKAQDKFEKANKKLKDAEKKYEKLKRKGKLSPNDELKWLDKLEGLREDVAKAKKKM